MARIVSLAEINDDAVTQHAGLGGADVEHQHILQRVQRRLVDVLGPVGFFHDRQGREAGRGKFEHDPFREHQAELVVFLVVQHQAVEIEELVDFHDDFRVANVRVWGSLGNARCKAGACEEREERKAEERWDGEIHS